ncbi:sulfotransferase [Tunicatimonas pelagia]|uniref:sulfotransferase n=1 Tax=Tunicatimonas pelagia TaxID=931531 RepID=UPI0026670DE1|nr:sulfotransferase [Tunicatimonas pelagia]WKN45156.1 sulfotransferase [Tunicatimonas pelagia]
MVTDKMKVDFMILGAQKSATSSLFLVLNAHPALQGSRKKEPQFFCTTPDWRNNLAAYHQLFSIAEDTLYFEASTTYTFYPIKNLTIWDDLYAYNPALKFIYMVRNPVQRIVSAYMHLYERGYTDFSLSEAIIKNRFYVDTSRYYTQIIPYIRKFGRENVLLIDFDDFNQSRSSALSDVADFLQIDPDGFGDYQGVKANTTAKRRKKHHKWDNPSLAFRAVRKFLPLIWERMTDNSDRAFHKKPKLNLRQQQLILHMLELEINELEKLMNKDLSHWKFIAE